MIKSMTGFGQGSAETEAFKVRVDIRTVNNRFLDVHTRLPQELSSLEVTLKKQIQAGVRRGRVDVSVSLDQARVAQFDVNRPLVSGYINALSTLKAEFGIGGEPTLEMIAKLPGALQASQDSSQLDEALISTVVAAVSRALVALTEMRIAEGQELAVELNARLCAIERLLPSVEEQATKLPQVYREKLARRIQEVVGGAPVDETRLAQEAVMLADRSDISEEIARLKSHIVQMRDALRLDDEIGKRLDFILQEMNREANTILSKSNDLAISDAAISIKTEVEKLREQAQNVE
ncbi:MAG TPA: YicC/YloC family endoribonuclease [Blastocatellia bacterium]|nr:YicC/YloC family endoribonuclease [Blastocatellia bacterium]